MQQYLTISCAFTILICMWLTARIVQKSSTPEQKNQIKNTSMHYPSSVASHPYVPQTLEKPWYLMPLKDSKVKNLENAPQTTKFAEPNVTQDETVKEYS